MESGSVSQRCCLLVEVHLNYGRVTVGAPLACCGDPVGTLREGDDAVAHIAIEPPFRCARRVEDEGSTALGAGTDSLCYHRMSTSWVRAQEAGHASTLA